MSDIDKRRRYISIMFECCSVYQRIYINKEKSKYEGRCPKCLRAIHVKIGSGGTSDRFFKAE